MPLPFGTPAPWFICPTPSNPRFAFSSVAGRYIVLGFLQTAAAAREAADAVAAANGDVFDETFACAFLVVRDSAAIAAAADAKGLRWFLDGDGAVSRLYGALDEESRETPHWLVLDPNARVLFAGEARALPQVIARLRTLPPPDQHAGVPMHAPVLIVPRVLEPDFCRRLIALYEATGGEPSGVMREIGGRTVGVLDGFKRRRDAQISDPDLQAGLRVRLKHRLLPEIEKAFNFAVTRIERYIVACYDAEEGGYFRPHRDNTTAGTAHRKFAVSINLNAEDYDGGDLRFPEFGMRTYRAPSGGAVVFGCSLLHEATPVTRGRRYATLPFLYDDAGAQLRQRNLHLLAPPDPTADATTAVAS